MARFSMRRVVSCVAPSVLTALVMLSPGASLHSPDGRSPYVIKIGTDVFGGGTGGAGSHATSMYSSSYDTAGWGIAGMKPLTPPAPDPALSVIPSRGDFGPLPGSDYLGANGYGGPLGAGVGSGNLGGTLQPLRGSAYSR
jgi:hypothetical protein